MLVPPYEPAENGACHWSEEQRMGDAPMGDELVYEVAAYREQNVNIRESPGGCPIECGPITESAVSDGLADGGAQCGLGKWVHVIPLLRRAAEFTGRAV